MDAVLGSEERWRSQHDVVRGTGRGAVYVTRSVNHGMTQFSVFTGPFGRSAHRHAEAGKHEMRYRLCRCGRYCELEFCLCDARR
jgi:hypothetical protein